MRMAEEKEGVFFGIQVKAVCKKKPILKECLK
jgi:hypothetical protein